MCLLHIPQHPWCHCADPTTVDSLGNLLCNHHVWIDSTSVAHLKPTPCSPSSSSLLNPHQTHVGALISRVPRPGPHWEHCSLYRAAHPPTTTTTTTTNNPQPQPQPPKQTSDDELACPATLLRLSRRGGSPRGYKRFHPWDGLCVACDWPTGGAAARGRRKRGGIGLGLVPLRAQWAGRAERGVLVGSRVLVASGDTFSSGSGCGSEEGGGGSDSCSDFGSGRSCGSGKSYGRGSGFGSSSGYSSGSSAGSGSGFRYRGKRVAGDDATIAAEKGNYEVGWENWQGLVADGYETVDGKPLNSRLLRTLADKKRHFRGVFVHVVEEKKGRGEWAIHEGRSAVFLMPGCYDPTLVGEDSRKKVLGALAAAALAGVGTVGQIAERWLKYGLGWA